MFEMRLATPTVAINNGLLSQKKINLWLKRDDLIHPEISGNKWRKLKYNLIEAKKLGYTQILTFGGAYSNHIAATAAAAKTYGFKSVGIIRGDELNPQSNPTLQKAYDDGMDLEFISRSQFQRKNDPLWLKDISNRHHAYIIPEGGSNQLATLGVKEIISEIDVAFDIIACAVGTGGTLAGLTSGLSDKQQALGYAVLKGERYLEDEVNSLLILTQQHQKKIIHNYHFGGYAKFNKPLLAFIDEFKKEFGIPLDPIYTGKMMYGLFDQIKNDAFAPNTNIIAIHTGGLQGIKGFNKANQVTLVDH